MYGSALIYTSNSCKISFICIKQSTLASFKSNNVKKVCVFHVVRLSLQIYIVIALSLPVIYSVSCDHILAFQGHDRTVSFVLKYRELN